MQVLIAQEPGGWGITALEGPLQGQYLGSAEALRLQDVTLRDDGTLTAHALLAVHGASYREPVFDHPSVVRALGVQGVFPSADEPVTFDPLTRCWTDSTHGAPMRVCTELQLRDGQAFHQPTRHRRTGHAVSHVSAHPTLRHARYLRRHR